MNSTMRHHFLRTYSAVTGAGLLQACGTGTTITPQTKTTSATTKAQTMQPKQPHPPRSDDNLLRVVAPPGFAEDSSHVITGPTRLYDAGFTVISRQAGSHRHQRFVGSDAQRVIDFQDVAGGRARTPRVLMGLRGGYGAARILPQIDFVSLGARMRGRGTLFFGFSNIYAVRLALLAKGNMMNFAGPMVYNEFGKTNPSVFTMDSFVHGTANNVNIVGVPTIQRVDVNVEGTSWGDSLSVLAPLAGMPYMPDIQGGILFVEDVNEQSCHIEHMLNMFYPSSVLQKQRAIIFGDPRMGTIRDTYDSSYDFSAVINYVSRAAKTPVLTDSPFGHTTNKTTSPLGVYAKVCSTGGGNYSATFDDYPTLNPFALTLNNLLPPPVPTYDSTIYRDSITEEVTE